MGLLFEIWIVDASILQPASGLPSFLVGVVWGWLLLFVLIVVVGVPGV